MLQEISTDLPARDVIQRAKAFFAERVPHYGAYLEKEGPNHAVFRGHGGEEIAIAVIETGDVQRVRGSSPFYGQAIGRFFSTLPRVEQA
jgi:hypothetical protein